MDIGISAPQQGLAARAAAVHAVAAAAEHVGYASIWASDATERGFDPFVLLGAVAATTRRTRLGVTAVAAAHRPAVLARSVSTLQALGGGRLAVSCTVDDAEELAHLLHELDGAADARGVDDPTTPQRRPTVLLTCGDADGLVTAGTVADGWQAADLSGAQVRAGWRAVVAAAERAGRDAGALRLVVRATIRLDPAPGHEPGPFAGPLGRVVDELVAVRDAGAHELVLAVGPDLGLDEALDTYARVAEELGGP